MDNFEMVKESDEVLDIGAHKWYGSSDRTDDKLMHDKGVGNAVAIRLFEFVLRPDLKVLPTKEEVLTPSYIKSLQAQLWSDGLRLVMEPRIIIDKESIKIFAPCQAATGNNFIDEPKTLQEWIK